MDNKPPGPNDYLLGKLSSLPSLQALTADAAMDWYDELARTTAPYHLGLIPFEGLVPRYAKYAFFLPGAGYLRYRASARSLLLLLPRVIPMNNAALTTQLQLARGEDDGFDFLW